MSQAKADGTSASRLCPEGAGRGAAIGSFDRKKSTEVAGGSKFVTLSPAQIRGAILAEMLKC